VAAQNLDAVRASARAAIPVLERALGLESRIDDIQRAGLLEDGAIDVAQLATLEAPLRAEADALARLENELREHRSGWLLPPLWHELDEQLGRVDDLERSAAGAAEAVRLAPALLGGDGPRSYLVLIVNNAELRGAGGILSGIGEVTVSDGRLELGRFQHYKTLADEEPFRPVPAPADFRSHFGRYRAHTTRWVATSSSPDVPDVSVVARRLYELTAGRATDGTIVVDPRGLQAMVPRDTRIEVPRTDTVVTRGRLADYVYSQAYEDLAEDQTKRRDSLIVVGQGAFEAIVGGGLRLHEAWPRIGAAAVGGHIRFLPARADERQVFDALGVTGELGAPESDAALVTVQNYGGTKLDFWARRSVEHRCDLAGGVADCGTEVTIANRTPAGLPEFVTQYRPYGLFKNYVEVYVPAGARPTGVQVDGEPAGAFTEREDGFRAIGVYVEIPRGQETVVSVGYELPLESDEYSLEVIPQPLARDAHLEVALGVPPGWTVEGDGELDDGVLRFSGDLDGRMEWRAGPREAGGLTGLWDALVGFWREPLL
jgi:hypothetical protein